MMQKFDRMDDETGKRGSKSDGDRSTSQHHVGNRMRRGPRSREATAKTSQGLSDLLPRFLGQLGAAHHERADLILASWPQIIGAKLLPMTKAVSFVDGILLVKVNNSTLYSLLSQHERGRLLKSLKEKFPSAMIKNIVFRLG